MNAIEDVTTQMSAIDNDPPEKQKATREEWIKPGGLMHLFWTRLEALVKRNGVRGYTVGGSDTVADLKVCYFVRRIKTGRLDFVPTTFPDGFPELFAIYKRVVGMTGPLMGYTE